MPRKPNDKEEIPSSAANLPIEYMQTRARDLDAAYRDPHSYLNPDSQRYELVSEGGKHNASSRFVESKLTVTYTAHNLMSKKVMIPRTFKH